MRSSEYYLFCGNPTSTVVRLEGANKFTGRNEALSNQKQFSKPADLLNLRPLKLQKKPKETLSDSAISCVRTDLRARKDMPKKFPPFLRYFLNRLYL